MWLNWLMLASLALVVFPLSLALVNLRRYRASDSRAAVPADRPLVTVCIPARNEAANIEACVRSALGNDYPNLEVLVYDDQSTDETPRIIARLAAEDPRVRTTPSVPLPAGWNGKQHACWRMAGDARGEWVLFTDADVRLSRDCLRRTLGFALSSGSDLVSTFPRQVTRTLGESLLIPMIFFLLLSYLPMGRMRTTKDPAASAGCGQFLFVKRAAYFAAGGHEVLKDSMHDGIKLVRALRRAGSRTDLFDGTDLAVCRMYRGLEQTWRGFAKNAYEGLGSVPLLVFITAVHVIGHVLPWAVVLAAAGLSASAGTRGLVPQQALVLAMLAIVFAWIHRAVLAARFKQDPLGAALHPVGVVLMTLIQWHSFVLHATGRRSWKGRTAGPAVQPAA